MTLVSFVYFIPIFAVVLTGLLHRRMPPLAAKVGLIGGVLVVAAGYFIPPFSGWIGPRGLHEYHFLGTVFVALVLTMLAIARLQPLPEPWRHVDVGAVDMSPWRHASRIGLALVAPVVLTYAAFAKSRSSHSAGTAAPSRRNARHFCSCSARAGHVHWSPSHSQRTLPSPRRTAPWHATSRSSPANGPICPSPNSPR